MNKAKVGRPATKPGKLMNGFYIEVRNKGANSGVKIWSANKEAMLRAGKNYAINKDVIFLGEHKDGEWVK